MIADLKPYAEYKESGLPWLGRVPGQWDVSPLAGLARLKSLVNQSERQLLSVYLQRGVVRFADVDEKRTNATSEDLSHYQAVDPGDFVLNNQQAWRGSVGVSDYTGIVSPAYLVLALSKRYSGRYANLLFRDQSMVSQYLVCSKGVGTIQRNLYWPHLKRVGVVVPPLDDQSAIVRFLDWANGRLERAIRAKRKVIALLNEQKQAIIHRAVTRGLDPSVPVKPSGIPWLGDIPQHWEVRRLKHAFTRIVGGSTPASGNPAYWNGGVVWVTPADVSKSAFLVASIRNISRKGMQACSTELVPEDSIILTSRAPVGNVALARVPLCTNQGCKALISDASRVIPMFGFWVLSVMKAELQSRASGTTFAEISTTKLAASAMPLPALDEQERILDFIATETETIDRGVSRLQREIELLREYRTRLVADVVTGKFDVREAAARLPDEGPLESVEDHANLGDETETADEEVAA